MNSEHTEAISEQRPSSNLAVSETQSDESSRDALRGGETGREDTSSDRAVSVAATDSAGATPARDTKAGADATPIMEVSAAKLRMQNRLPALEDDGDVGVQKEYVVTRDEKADLRFNGMLLASAAPAMAVKGHWQEYRIFQTDGDKHVFSKVKRTVFVGEEDAYEAQVFDPSPSSVSSQLLRSAREIARSRPLTWMDAAAAFFGYDPLAKALYRKLNVRFEEHIG